MDYFYVKIRKKTNFHFEHKIAHYFEGIHDIFQPFFQHGNMSNWSRRKNLNFINGAFFGVIGVYPGLYSHFEFNFWYDIVFWVQILPISYFLILCLKSTSIEKGRRKCDTKKSQDRKKDRKKMNKLYIDCLSSKSLN